jgi:hypothetical protein
LREDTWSAFAGLKVLPPAFFITGDADPGYFGHRDNIAALSKIVPNLKGT